MKTTLTPRDYQMNAVTTICNAHRRSNSRIVLAAATGSGKTEMAIMIIDNFIRRRLGRVLVITHHTNIIKSNFIDRLNDINVSFTYSDVNTNADCFIAIRSTSLNRIDFEDFDLLVVDEAHQNYFASTVQSITNYVSHQVLLTATPSKFVRAGGFNILPVARLDIPNNYFASLSFRVVNAETSVTNDSYNDDNVVKSTVKFHRSEVKSMCDSVIAYLDDSKKLFICKDIEQAKSTALYLTSIGIVTKVSDSKSDADSQIANQFKSGDINSICVVDRMRVGYSDNNLYHTVDMSFTHNPDVIMQILSRSNRGNQSQCKTYIKVTNDTLNLRTRVMLSIALSLFRADNMCSFDGTFASVNVPVTKQSAQSRQTGSPSSEWFIPDSVDIVDFFSNCDFVNANDIIRAFGDSAHYNYQYCLDIAKKYSSWSEICKYETGARSWLIRNDLRDRFLDDAGYKPVTSKSRAYMMSDMTNEIAFEFASQCESYYEFRTKYSTAFRFATNANILSDLIASNGNYLYMPTYTCKCCNSTFRSKANTALYCSKECKNKVRLVVITAQRANQKLLKCK